MLISKRLTSSREGLSGDDEGRGVGAEVEEEVGEAVEGDEGLGTGVDGFSRGRAEESVVSEAEDDD